VIQETLGWDDVLEETLSQRNKEEAHDYRYFPEPDLPPLVVEPTWIEAVRAELPELPQVKLDRFVRQYQLPEQDAAILVSDPALADYFEQAVAAGGVLPKTIANWIQGELFSLMNQAGVTIEAVLVSPQNLRDLLERLEAGAINPSTAKIVLAEMFATSNSAEGIIAARGLQQISQAGPIAELITAVLADHPAELQAYYSGKETLFNWFFGQAMQRARNLANPKVVRSELQRQLAALRPR
jgi:aspartyl-tRNA(Asn)/glutamyl-tRNA(Gln) amidotransferase subunit B